MEKNSEEVEFSKWMREFYNKKARKISDKGYEHARWFSSSRKKRQYVFSMKSLLFHLDNVDFKECLEIGCGPGTWTSLLLEKYPGADFTCVDISREMISQLNKKLGKRRNVKSVVSSFLDYDSKEKYDFIFSSRAIEYIPNKSKVIRKINSLMKDGGKGVIITSPPHDLIVNVKKAMGKKFNKNHTQRISVEKMRELLRINGFIEIKFYPILFSDFFLVPTSFLFKSMYKKRWNLLSKMFATGYIVTFNKKNGKKNSVLGK